MQEFRSKRNGRKIAVAGYIYLLDRQYVDYSTWRCEQSRWNSNRCFGRGTLNSEGFTTSQDHNHLPDLNYVEAEIAKVSFKDFFN